MIISVYRAKARRSTQSYGIIGGGNSDRQSKMFFVGTLSYLWRENKNKSV